MPPSPLFSGEFHNYTGYLVEETSICKAAKGFGIDKKTYQKCSRKYDERKRYSDGAPCRKVTCVTTIDDIYMRYHFYFCAEGYVAHA